MSKLQARLKVRDVNSRPSIIRLNTKGVNIYQLKDRHLQGGLKTTTIYLQETHFQDINLGSLKVTKWKNIYYKNIDQCKGGIATLTSETVDIRKKKSTKVREGPYRMKRSH